MIPGPRQGNGDSLAEPATQVLTVDALTGDDVPDSKSLDWFIVEKALPFYLVDAVQKCRSNSRVTKHVHLATKLNCALKNGRDSAWIEGEISRALDKQHDPSNPKFSPPDVKLTAAMLVSRARDALIRALEAVPGNEADFATRASADQRWQNRRETARPAKPG